MAMVVRANKVSSELGGHIATYQSLATLYEVGFNHFWHAPSDEHGGDLVYFQGHSSPGNYARAYLEGRLTEDQLDGFRQEVSRDGLASYPHPWLMPDFWQFPTVSLGIGAITSIYQARFMKYLKARGLADTDGRKVWAFLGDGEMDEPESMGAIGLAGRERLDNLIWVVNCNLQRLDGPVRGNGKIIQELESDFRGAGWNVIKVVWGSRWDPLLAADTDGALVRVMEECVDGDYQTFKSRDGAYVREHFFGRDPRLLKRVEHMSDEEIWLLNRGGHDQQKVYAAYHEAVRHTGQPTVILAKTIKGYGMGVSGEGQMITHQAKKMTEDALLAFRDRFELPLTDEQVRAAEYYKPPDDSPEMHYLRECRAALGGSLPVRAGTPSRCRPRPRPVQEPARGHRRSRDLDDDGVRARARGAAARQADRPPHRPDHPRRVAHVRHGGPVPPARDLLPVRPALPAAGLRAADVLQGGPARPDPRGGDHRGRLDLLVHRRRHVLQRPRRADGAVLHLLLDVRLPAGRRPRLGRRRQRTRGFMLGGTAGRTTLNGEGLQHEDGHSHLLFSVVPNCRAYDPTFGYEVAVIIQDGLRRMVGEQEDVFYYVTLMNENYRHPPMPEGARGGNPARDVPAVGDAPTHDAPAGPAARLGHDPARGARRRRDARLGLRVGADVWSVTSFTELRRDGIEVERHNMLHPLSEQRSAYVTDCLRDRRGPVIASTDYLRAFADQIRQWVPDHYRVLGTDGFGRSDFRHALRRFFEVDRHYVVVAALKELADNGEVDARVVQDAIERYHLDPEAPIPTSI